MAYLYRRQFLKKIIIHVKKLAQMSSISKNGLCAIIIYNHASQTVHQIQSVRNVEFSPTYPKPNCKRFFASYSLIFFHLKMFGSETLHTSLHTFPILAPHLMISVPICSQRSENRYGQVFKCAELVFWNKQIPHTLFSRCRVSVQNNWLIKTRRVLRNLHLGMLSFKRHRFAIRRYYIYIYNYNFSQASPQVIKIILFLYLWVISTVKINLISSISIKSHLNNF